MYLAVWKTKVPPQKKTPYAMLRTKGLLITVLQQFQNSSAFFTSFEFVFLWVKKLRFRFPDFQKFKSLANSEVLDPSSPQQTVPWLWDGEKNMEKLR